MPGRQRPNRRRNSLYVKQNKAYQMLLATLIIAFLIVTAVVVTTSGTGRTSSFWRDNVLIRMIVERNAARYSNNQ